MGKGCSIVRETVGKLVGYHIFDGRSSMTSHGKKDARSEQGGISAKGQMRPQNDSECRRRGWSLAVEAEHVGLENIIHRRYDHTALYGLRLIVARHQGCDFGFCSFG